MGTVTNIDRYRTGRHRPKLPPAEPPAGNPDSDPRWELRGQPRTRETFALPHPGDFPGGLPIPREYS